MKMMQKMIRTLAVFSIAFYFFTNTIHAQAGTNAADRIAERIEAQETSSSDQDLLVAEIAEAAREAGRVNPNNAAAVKTEVRRVLDEIRDRTTTAARRGQPRKPGGADNKEVREWIKKLKRDLMDSDYVALPRIFDTDLLVRAFGNGESTGGVVTYSLHNPTDQTIYAETGAYYMPAEIDPETGELIQNYVLHQSVLAAVPPGATIFQVQDGFCANIHAPAAPAGMELNTSQWIPISENPELPDGWTPNPQNGWQPDSGSTALVPGTDQALGHSIDANKFPGEAALILPVALMLIKEGFDQLKDQGVTNSPMYELPEKDGKSPAKQFEVQNTFWAYAAEMDDKPEYTFDDFSRNMDKNFEKHSGFAPDKAPDDVKDNYDTGKAETWANLATISGVYKLTKIDDAYSTWGAIIERQYQVYKNWRTMGKTHEDALNRVFGASSAREKYGELFRERFEAETR